MDFSDALGLACVWGFVAGTLGSPSAFWIGIFLIYLLYVSSRKRTG